MKRIRVFLCLALLSISLWAGLHHTVHANELTPLSLLDINSLPSVATDGNDNFTITWGYLGLGHLPGILAKRYDATGEPIDTTEFWVNSSSILEALINYDPDIAIDSSNNAVIAWCSYGLMASESNVQVTYTKIPDPTPPIEEVIEPEKFAEIKPQQSEEAGNPLSIPMKPAVAVDDSDNIAIVWSYLDLGTRESGIKLAIVDSGGTAGAPVTVVSNIIGSLEGIFRVNQSITEPVFYHSPDIAIDGEGNIVVTWTASGLLPFFNSTVELPLTAIYYSKFTSSGAVVSGYEKQLVDVGFNSTVAVHDDRMIIAWNVIDLFSLKVRIMASVFGGEIMSSDGPIKLGTRSGYSPSAFVDAGNYLLNTGIDVAADANGNFFVTWGGSNVLNSHIYLKEIYADGGSLSNEIQISQGFDSNKSPSIAIDTQGNIIVTWNRVSPVDLFSGMSSIFARRYNNNLQALGDEFKVNLSY